MFSPLNDSKVEEWLARLNAPLKRLPAQERAELHLEVRQHLDALVAANQELGSSSEESWELALTQFGNPTRIGQRLFQECQESRSGLSLGWIAIGFGISVNLVLEQVALLLQQHFGDISHPVAPANFLLGGGSAILMALAVGRKYPFHALKGAFYAIIFWHFVILLIVLPQTLHTQTENYGSRTAHVTVSLNILPLIIGILINCVVAYLASVTKRGWYKPSLGDFKLTLPRRRLRLSR